MARVLKYQIPGLVALSNSIAPNQNGVAGIPLTLVGGSPVVLAGVTDVTLTSGANDLSGINFTITGTQNGIVFSVVVKGAAANATVTVPDVFFDTIISVTPSADANGISVGIGANQIFPLIKLNPDVSNRFGGPYWALSVTDNTNAGVLNTVIYQTLDEFAGRVINTKNMFTAKTSAGANILIGNMGISTSAYNANTNVIAYVNEILVQASTPNGATMIFRQS